MNLDKLIAATVNESVFTVDELLRGLTGIVANCDPNRIYNAQKELAYQISLRLKIGISMPSVYGEPNSTPFTTLCPMIRQRAEFLRNRIEVGLAGGDRVLS